MTVAPNPNLQLLYVSDIGRSTDFYKTIFEAEPVFSSPRYVAFGAGKEALFAIWTGAEDPDFSARRCSEVGIMLPSNEEVQKLFEKWKDNSDIKIVTEPRTEIFGLTFLVEDPDGNLIRVCPLD